MCGFSCVANAGISFPSSSGCLGCCCARLEERLWMSAGWNWVSEDHCGCCVSCCALVLRWESSCLPFLCCCKFGLALKHNLEGKEVFSNRPDSSLRATLTSLRAGIFPGAWCRCRSTCEHLSFKCYSQICYGKSHPKGRWSNCSTRQSEANISVGDFIFIFLMLLCYCVHWHEYRRNLLLSIRSSEVRIKSFVFFFNYLRIVQ